jgi:hypothetical protein
MTEQAITFAAEDGWRIGALQRLPDQRGERTPGAVLVPGSRHERDSFTTTADALEQHGMASLRIDIRGRGASRGKQSFSRLPPAARRDVKLDVAAAVTSLRQTCSGPVAVVVEQDTAADAIAGALDAGAAALVVLSAIDSTRGPAAVSARTVPVLGIASTEDRAGLRGTVNLYLVGSDRASQLDVGRGRGMGATMFFSKPPKGQPALESVIATWLAERFLGPSSTTGRARGGSRST